MTNFIIWSQILPQMLFLLEFYQEKHSKQSGETTPCTIIQVPLVLFDKI